MREFSIEVQKMKIRIQNEERWYQKGGWIAALIILFFPIGIVVMWRHSKWRMRTKVLITAFFALAVASGGQERDVSRETGGGSWESKAPANEQDHAAVQKGEVDHSELNRMREEELERKHLAAAVDACERCNYSGPCYAKFIPSDNSPSFDELGGYWSCYLLSSRANGGWQQLLQGPRRHGLRYDWRFLDNVTFQTVDHHNGSLYSEFKKGTDGYWYGFSGGRQRKETRIRFIELPDDLKNEEEVQAQNELILELHRQGKSLREIQKELGIRWRDVKEAIKASED